MKPKRKKICVCDIGCCTSLFSGKPCRASTRKLILIDSGLHSLLIKAYHEEYEEYYAKDLDEVLSFNTVSSEADVKKILLKFKLVGR